MKVHRKALLQRLSFFVVAYYSPWRFIMDKNLIEKLSLVSSEPGVYLMKDSKNSIIYAGKAKNLKKRVSSYFLQQGRHDLKTEVLVGKIADFDTIITASEQEALILESNLIKKYKPRYNIILKDGKQYPSIKIDIKNKFPSVSVVRKIKKDGSLFFGPFASSLSVRNTLKIINKTFMLRKCKKGSFANRTRPCLNYQIKACLGPCCNEISQKEYDENVREVILFLKGKTQYLSRRIKNNMVREAENQNYEEAAKFRDKLFAIQTILEKQVAVTTDLMDRDIIATAGSSDCFIITVLFVRGGLLVGSTHFEFSDVIADSSEKISTFIRQYYEKNHFVPKEILLPFSIDDNELVEQWLSTVKGRKVRILFPERGEKKRLVEMGENNAKKEYLERISTNAAIKKMLERLQIKLKLATIPMRIECFDNSNISGTSPVAAMVVFENGKPDKSSYRKYKIKTVKYQDDYAYMSEVLTRRYLKSDKEQPWPDLLMVDGGKGQLNIAVNVMKELNIEGAFEIVGIAKMDSFAGETEDKIYKPGRSNPMNLDRDEALLRYLMQIRDEAHRFAITFHRNRRGKTSIASQLDLIPGIGKKRKQILFKHFGSIDKIKKASVSDIACLPGMNHNIAKVLIKYLKLEYKPSGN